MAQAVGEETRVGGHLCREMRSTRTFAVRTEQSRAERHLFFPPNLARFGLLHWSDLVKDCAVLIGFGSTSADFGQPCAIWAELGPRLWRETGKRWALFAELGSHERKVG